jgi:hypothetical protein
MVIFKVSHIDREPIVWYMFTIFGLCIAGGVRKRKGRVRRLQNRIHKALEGAGADLGLEMGSDSKGMRH